MSKGTVGYHCNHKLDENPISISHGTRTAIHTSSTQTNRHHSTINFHEYPNQITAVANPKPELTQQSPSTGSWETNTKSPQHHEYAHTSNFPQTEAQDPQPQHVTSRSFWNGCRSRAHLLSLDFTLGEDGGVCGLFDPPCPVDLNLHEKLAQE